MIPSALIQRLFPYVMAAIILVAMCGYYYRLGVNTTDTAWQSKWDAQALELSEAKAKVLTLVREEEQRRQSAIDEVRQHAEQQIARAEADATAADAAAHSLREQARRLATRASQCASYPNITQSGTAAGQPAVVLADLLSRADARAGELARAYDRSRTAGLACQRAYLSLTSPH